MNRSAVDFDLKGCSKLALSTRADFMHLAFCSKSPEEAS